MQPAPKYTFHWLAEAVLAGPHNFEVSLTSGRLALKLRSPGSVSLQGLGRFWSPVNYLVGGSGLGLLRPLGLLVAMATSGAALREKQNRQSVRRTLQSDTSIGIHAAASGIG